MPGDAAEEGAGVAGGLVGLAAGRSCSNRSEFVRAELVKQEWEEQTGETVGVLVLVYDHDTRALTDKLNDIQHQSEGVITTALPSTSTPTAAWR
jgi:metal-responsive CopG/Arc/MetJ family transcriptional regulator